MQTLQVLWLLALVFTLRLAATQLYAKLSCHFPITCAARACERYPGMCRTDTGTIVYPVPFMAEMLYDDRASVCRVDGDPDRMAWCRVELQGWWARAAAAVFVVAALGVLAAAVNTL